MCLRRRQTLHLFAGIRGYLILPTTASFVGFTGEWGVDLVHRNSFYQVMWLKCLILSVTCSIGAAVHCQQISVTRKPNNKLNELRPG